MRRPNKARPSGNNAELDMAPLIDCVFLLLTYFLFTISLATIEGLLPSELALGAKRLMCGVRLTQSWKTTGIRHLECRSSDIGYTAG